MKKSGTLALLLGGAAVAALALRAKSQKQQILDDAQEALDTLPRDYTANQLAAAELTTVGDTTAAQAVAELHRQMALQRDFERRSAETFLLLGGAGVITALLLRNRGRA